MVSLVGIVGQKGSGKDTTADFLVSRYGFVKQSFATPLKDVCRELFLLSDEQLNHPEKKEAIDTRWGLSPRQMMQWMGTDVVRAQLGIDFWVRRMDMYHRTHSDQRLVVPDVRFENEAQWIRDNGGILIRVERTSVVPIDTHASEVEQTAIRTDMTIKNDSASIESYWDTLTDVLCPRLSL